MRSGFYRIVVVTAMAVVGEHLVKGGRPAFYYPPELGHPAASNMAIGSR